MATIRYNWAKFNLMESTSLFAIIERKTTKRTPFSAQMEDIPPANTVLSFKFQILDLAVDEDLGTV